jgi:hypothetical protein
MFSIDADSYDYKTLNDVRASGNHQPDHRQAKGIILFHDIQRRPPGVVGRVASQGARLRVVHMVPAAAERRNRPMTSWRHATPTAGSSRPQ